MKTASPALVAFPNAARANPDTTIAFAECFAFTLATGATLAYTNVDQPVGSRSEVCWNWLTRLRAT